MDDDAWSGIVLAVRRAPSGCRSPPSPQMRRREIEIHHADLGTVYGHEDWPQDFVVELLDVVTVDQASAGPFTAHASRPRTKLEVGGAGGPTVTGSGVDLGWWLTGRGG